MACLYGAAEIVNPGAIENYLLTVPADLDWLYSSLAVSAIVLTKTIGILVENFLVSKRCLGPEIKKTAIDKDFDSYGETHILLNAYTEFEDRHLLLDIPGRCEADYGRLKCVLAKFFLANNTLASFALGIAFAIVNFVINPSWHALGRSIEYAGVMGVCLVVGYKIAVMRFNVLARSIWAARSQCLTSAAG